MANEPTRCDWCGTPRRSWSDWEQQGVTDKLWKRLCSRCANRRLDNPWNALLPMRKILTEAIPGGTDA